MSKFKYAIISIIVVVVLMLGLVVVKNNSFNSVMITYDKLTTDGIKDDYALLFFGDIDKEKKKTFKEINKNYNIPVYSIKYDETNFLQLISENDLEYDGINENNILIYVKGKPVIVINYLAVSILEEQLDKYMFGIIPQSERYYTELATGDEAVKKINSNEYSVIVFGKESCSYCTLYLPIINKIALEKKINIYYIDQDKLSEDEYNKIVEFNFEIPAKCTTSGFSTTMKSGFPKPMTIITKKGKYVDCIKGYVKEQEVLDTLSKYKIIKEK